MITQEIPSVVVWANAASEQEIETWILDRLHGRDRLWAEYDDGFSPHSHLVAVVVNHAHTRPAASASIVQSVVRSVFAAIPEWAKTEEKILPDDATFGDWTAPALSDLMLLATEILQSAPRRAEFRSFLIHKAPDLPMKVGKLPLRTKALVAIVELGGNADRQFWLDQIDPYQPEATPIAFLGMAKHDLDQALAWLGSRSVEEQGDVIRKLRPTLIKMAGGETPFVFLVRQHLFRSNYAQANELRQELAPVGDQALYLYEAEIILTQRMGGRLLPFVESGKKSIERNRPYIFLFTRIDQLQLTASEIAVTRFRNEYSDYKFTRTQTDDVKILLSKVLKNFLSRESHGLIPEIVEQAAWRVITESLSR